MPRNIVLLGCTGSIGRSALSVLREMRDDYRVVGLSAWNNTEQLAADAIEFDVPYVAVATPEGASTIAGRLPGSTTLMSGCDALVRLVEDTNCDFVLAAIVGAAGIRPVLRAVELGKTVGVANKEPLVLAGRLIMETAAQTGALLLPIDSEHSAIFQSMQGARREEVARIVLTASGGPFRTWSTERIREATRSDALKHPTWSMGPKITVDSATMMNKALEIIEARWLFAMEPDQIEVLVHPESVIHSMVEFVDGSVMAQLGAPDMRVPIQYALTWPRRTSGPAKRLDWTQLRNLNFESHDPERFPAIALGYDVARRGGTAGAVMNAANEAAVDAFLNDNLRFCEIVPLVRDVMERHEFVSEPSFDELMAVDAWARDEVHECCQV